MPLFNVPQRAGKAQDRAVANKSKTTVKATTSVKGGSSLLGRINQIKAVVEKNLGQFKDKKQRHYFANKGLSSQGYGFSSGHI